MTAYTDRGVPYVSSGEPAGDYPTTSQELADYIDARMPRSGLVVVPITAANTDTDVSVTFAVPYPTGEIPVVVATPNAATNLHTWTVPTVTETGFTLRAKRSTGTAAVGYMWLAAPQ